MNKRMKEPFHTIMWKASIGYNDSWSQVDPEVLEKFAELIIEECIKQVNKDHRPGGRESWDISLDNAIRNIKEHFGI